MRGVPLGNEPVVCELEMMTRMDDENVLHRKENLVDYTQLGTMGVTVLDERQHLAGWYDTGNKVKYGDKE